MTFTDQLKRFELHVETRLPAVFDGCCEEAFRGVVEGSALTGAPGQPVGQYGPGYHPGKVGGYLKASWQRMREGTWRELIATDAPYARAIEDLIGKYGPLNIRSTVGGGHSVKMVVAAWQRIVEAVNATVPK